MPAVHSLQDAFPAQLLRHWQVGVGCGTQMPWLLHTDVAAPSCAVRVDPGHSIRHDGPPQPAKHIHSPVPVLPSEHVPWGASVLRPHGDVAPPGHSASHVAPDQPDRQAHDPSVALHCPCELHGWHAMEQSDPVWVDAQKHAPEPRTPSLQLPCPLHATVPTRPGQLNEHDPSVRSVRFGPYCPGGHVSLSHAAGFNGPPRSHALPQYPAVHWMHVALLLVEGLDEIDATHTPRPRHTLVTPPDTAVPGHRLVQLLLTATTPATHDEQFDDGSQYPSCAELWHVHDPSDWHVPCPLHVRPFGPLAHGVAHAGPTHPTAHSHSPSRVQPFETPWPLHGDNAPPGHSRSQFVP
eukprot:PhM_4_TR18074/c1_g1_i1/m.44538